MVEVEKNRSIKIEVEAAKVKPFVIVGIPAFNEERTIAKVVLKSQRFADKVVVCDDGSGDMTAEIAERLGADVAKHVVKPIVEGKADVVVGFVVC